MSDEFRLAIFDPEYYPEDAIALRNSTDEDAVEFQIYQPVLDDFLSKNPFVKSFENLWLVPLYFILYIMSLEEPKTSTKSTKQQIIEMAKRIKQIVVEDRLARKKRKAEERQIIRSIISYHIRPFNNTRRNSLLEHNQHGERIRTQHRFTSRRYIDKYIGK